MAALLFDLPEGSSWADMMDTDAPAPKKASAPTQLELDMLAETSKDGINLLFKKVRAGTGAGVEDSGAARAHARPARRAARLSLCGRQHVQLS